MRNVMVLLLAAVATPLSAQSAPFEAARATPTTPGEWRYVTTAQGSEARFGELFAVRCARASRLVSLQRLDIAGPVALTITTDMLARAVPASGTLGSADPLLDAIAFSRGRFLVDGGGAQRLAIPAMPEAARSIEDCRN